MSNGAVISDARKTAQAGEVGNGLARKQVSDIQRARLLAAMVEVVGERGALNANVSHVVARSGVSRRTFYEIFEGREECFLAAFEDAIERATASMLPAHDSDDRWESRVRACLTALLDFCEREPQLGRLLFVDSLGGGSRALTRRREVLRHAIDMVDEGRSRVPVASQPPQLSAEGVVGAVLSVIHTRISEEQATGLLDLTNQLMSMIVLPYLGRAAATRELERVVIRDKRPSPRREGNPLSELGMRLTYRTICVLEAVEQWPNGSNRQIAKGAGIADQGQISKLLARLHGLGLIENKGADAERGVPNAWVLTAKGQDLQSTIKQQVIESPGGVL